MKISVSIPKLCIGVALFICLTSNLSLWRALWAAVDVSHFSNILFLVSQFVMALSVTILFLSFFAWPRLIKIACTVFLLIAASSAYFMDNFGTIINASMLQNVVETDVHEATELLTVKLCCYLLLLGIIPSILMWRIPLQRYTWRKTLGTQLLIMLTCIIVTVAAIAINFKQFSIVHRQHKELRLLLTPVSPTIGMIQYLSGTTHLSNHAVKIIAADAHESLSYQKKTHKSLVIFVLGETARAQNFQLNGYPRPTNPRLSALPVINFPNAWSCGTSTAESVPCMFSLLDRSHYSTVKAKSEESLLDVLDRANVSVWWRDNNSDCKGACARIGMEDVRAAKDAKLCSADSCFDEILLKGLEKKIAEMPGDVFIVLHQKGSHGPKYSLRTPNNMKQFTPECDKDNVTDCSRDSIINAYDNTILYTDTVLADIIQLQQKLSAQYDTAMLYMSDHGESLGENGLYLHGLPYAISPNEQRHIPFIAWISPQFAEHTGLDLECIKKHTDAKYSHDNLFHTVLGLFDVQTTVYSPKLDVFNPCRHTPSLP